MDEKEPLELATNASLVETAPSHQSPLFLGVPDGSNKQNRQYKGSLSDSVESRSRSHSHENITNTSSKHKSNRRGHEAKHKRFHASMSGMQPTQIKPKQRNIRDYERFPQPKMLEYTVAAGVYGQFTTKHLHKQKSAQLPKSSSIKTRQYRKVQTMRESPNIHGNSEKVDAHPLQAPESHSSDKDLLSAIDNIGSQNNNDNNNKKGASKIKSKLNKMGISKTRSSDDFSKNLMYQQLDEDETNKKKKRSVKGKMRSQTETLTSIKEKKPKLKPKSTAIEMQSDFYKPMNGNTTVQSRKESVSTSFSYNRRNDNRRKSLVESLVKKMRSGQGHVDDEEDEGNTFEYSHWDIENRSNQHVVQHGLEPAFVKMAPQKRFVL